MPLPLAVSRSAGKNLAVLMVAPEHGGGVSCCRLDAFYGSGAMMAEKMLYMNGGGGGCFYGFYHVFIIRPAICAVKLNAGRIMRTLSCDG